jgi:hypothetical protein
MADASPSTKKRRPRSRDLAAAGEVFGDFTPWRNPAAVYSYAVSLVALLPIVGLVLGPIAILLGFVGWIKRRRDPSVRGGNFATAGIVIGLIALLFNAVGTACITHGFGWW